MALLSLMLLLAAAPAAGGDLSGAFGAVLVMTGHPAMGDLRMKLRPDGTYEAALADGSLLRGTWTNDGAKVCFFARTLPRGCDTSILGKRVGDRWSVAIPKTDKVIGMALVAP